MQSKKMGETICHSYFTEKKNPAKVIRIFHTYGPGMYLNDGRVMMDFVKEIVIKNQITVKSSGKQKRSFCYISDMISAIFLVLIKGKNGEAYNAGNPKEFMSIKLLAQKISNKINGIKVIYKKRSNKDLYLKSTINNVNPCIKKISKLSFNPKINIENGFLRTIEYFKKKRKS
jgi:nucleoside-diphosphate-sugar epimerase